MNHDNKPLTLEELFEMNGQPVWVENIAHPEESEWRLFRYKMDNFACFSDMEDELCSLYYRTWLAYAHKPIDFVYREPCVHCEGCGNCVYFLYDDDEFPCNRCLRESTSNNPYPKFNPVGFCKFCGRPLTNEAREMLERRLTGHNNEQ